MQCNKLSRPEKWVLAGIPACFIFGSLLHFTYAFFGKSAVAGAVAAVNESVWEHCKMVLLPVILWWGLYYIFKGRAHGIDKNKWGTGALVSLVASLFCIPLLFYFYTEAFGVELLWVDILLLLIAVSVGQLTGLHFYRHSKGINGLIAFLLCVAIVFLFVIFTFYPPHIPIFKDGPTGSYGIWHS